MPDPAQCPNGGSQVGFGEDKNKNDVLDDAEVSSAITVCGGADGQVPLTRVISEPAGANCPGGGARLDVGTDDGRGGGVAGDGIFQNGEVTTSRYLCNGSNGQNGQNGQNGKDGLAHLVRVSTQPVGVSCAQGGQRIDIGADLSGDGVLSDAEVTSTSYACNGLDGITGPAGASEQMRTTFIAAGARSPAGGNIIELGLDDGRGGTAGDHVLQDGEVDRNFVVCDGQAGIGTSSLVRMLTEPAGANYAKGGKSILAGLDDGRAGGTAHDDVLDPGEIVSIDYICNGLDGVNGVNGTNGTNAAASLVVVGAEPVGAHCASGGRRIDNGLDGGGGGGVANDGILQAGEITSTSYVCNGANGVNGTNRSNGTDGRTSLVSVMFEPIGIHCMSGGHRIDNGFDGGAGGGIASDGPSPGTASSPTPRSATPPSREASTAARPFSTWARPRCPSSTARPCSSRARSTALWHPRRRACSPMARRAPSPAPG